MTVKLRNGQQVEPDGTEGRWGPARKCPECGELVWRIRHDRYGDVNTHMNKYGQRGECMGKGKKR